MAGNVQPQSDIYACRCVLLSATVKANIFTFLNPFLPPPDQVFTLSYASTRNFLKRIYWRASVILPRWAVLLGEVSIFSHFCSLRSRFLSMIYRANLAGIIFAAFLLLGCSSGDSNSEQPASSIRGSGKLSTEQRKVDEFHAIEIGLPSEIITEIGSRGDLSIETNENILPHITTVVTEGKLTISSDRNLNNMTKLVIKAPTKQLDSVQLEGANTLHLKGLSGGNLQINSNGASTIEADGNLDSLTVTLKGAGSLKALSLVAKHATISITGAGEAEVNATETLNATIAGAGAVKYKGEPKVTQNVMGAGEVQQIQ